MSKQKIIVILGQTASGKSNLAVEIAKKINGEIISADSRQVYNGLDIGSGKITKRETHGIPHHCLSYASPKRIHTVSQYKKCADKAIQDIGSRGKIPIICGGTGLYIDAVIYDQNYPQVKPDQKLRKQLEKLSAGELFAKLIDLDARRAKDIDRRNPRRLIRALEILLTTGKQIPKIKKRSPYKVLWLGIKVRENVLKNKIKKRLDKRIKAGLIAEVKKLHDRGISYARLNDLGLEYKFVALYLQNKISKKEMVATLNHEIWLYAKRQMTWFRKNDNIHWSNNKDEAMLIIKQFLRHNPALNSKF